MRINEKQRAALQYIRDNEPVSHETVDGRTGKALLARGLVDLRRHRLRTTEDGRRLLSGGVVTRPRKRRSKNPARAARANAILTATEQLAALMPAGAEVAVGPIFAAADDVIEAFRRFARQLEKP